MQLGKSITPLARLLVFQSVENVSGQKPAFMIAPMVSHLMWPFCPLPMSNQTPRRLAARLRAGPGRRRPRCCGGRGEHVSDDVAALQEREEPRERGHGLTHMDHQREAERGGEVLRPAKDLVVIRACHVAGQACLHSDDHVAVLRDRVARRADVGAGEVQRVAFGDDAEPADVDEDPGLLRCRARNSKSGRQCDPRPATRHRIQPVTPSCSTSPARRPTVPCECGYRSARERRACRARDDISAASAPILASTARCGHPKSRHRGLRRDGRKDR